MKWVVNNNYNVTEAELKALSFVDSAKINDDMLEVYLNKRLSDSEEAQLNNLLSQKKKKSLSQQYAEATTIEQKLSLIAKAVGL